MITVSTIPNMNLTVGHTESLSVTTSPTEAAVSAFSSDTSVAAVSAGGHTLTVTAGTKAGTATITVTASKSGYITGTNTFNVEQKAVFCSSIAAMPMINRHFLTVSGHWELR